MSNSLQPHGLSSWKSPGQNTGVGSLSLLQGIFPTQKPNRGLLHHRQILYQLSYVLLLSLFYTSQNGGSEKLSNLSKVTGEGNGTPPQYSCLENPMDGRAWKAAVHGVAESWTRLSNFTFTFHFHALEKEMATHSSVLVWRIPGMGEPGGLPSIGLHRVGHD